MMTFALRFPARSCRIVSSTITRLEYLEEGTRLVISAPLTRKQVRVFQTTRFASFRAIDGAGMARCDFFLERRTGKILVNELNTIPGFTAISMYPKLWEASGLPYPRLIDRLIELALKLHREKARTKYSIELPAGASGALDAQERRACCAVALAEQRYPLGRQVSAGFLRTFWTRALPLSTLVGNTIDFREKLCGIPSLGPEPFRVVSALGLAAWECPSPTARRMRPSLSPPFITQSTAASPLDTAAAICTAPVITKSWSAERLKNGATRSSSRRSSETGGFPTV